MTIFQALKKGSQLTVENLGLVSILFMTEVFVLVIIPFFFPLLVHTEDYTHFIAIIILYIMALLYPFLQGGLLGVLRDGMKEKHASLDRFPFYGSKYYFRLLGIGFLLGAVMYALIIAFLFVFRGMTSYGATLPLILLLVLLGISFIYFSVFLNFCPVVIVSEGSKIRQGLRLATKFFSSHPTRVTFLALIVMAVRIFDLSFTQLLGRLSEMFPTIVAILGRGLDSFFTVLANASLMAFYIDGAKGDPLFP